MTRFLGWYLAIVLAAYALSASWSLGHASEQILLTQQQAAQLASQVDTMRGELATLQHDKACASSPLSCAEDW